MLKSDFISVLVLGGIVGFIIWVFGAILNQYVFDVYFCQGDTSSQCGGAKNYSVVAASVIGSVVALAGLIRLRAYRPLLVLIASLLSTWGVAQASWGMGWFTAILVMVILYALAFGAYTWIARIREFWVAALVIVALVVAVRLVLTI